MSLLWLGASMKQHFRLLTRDCVSVLSANRVCGRLHREVNFHRDTGVVEVNKCGQAPPALPRQSFRNERSDHLLHLFSKHACWRHRWRSVTFSRHFYTYFMLLRWILASNKMSAILLGSNCRLIYKGRNAVFGSM